MLEEIRKSFIEEKFKMIVFSNKIDILNYKKIQSIKDDEIIIKSNEKEIRILGSNLAIIKLVSDEVLIEGIVDRIDYGQI